MNKKLIEILLIIAMLFSMNPITVFAASAYSAPVVTLDGNTLRWEAVTTSSGYTPPSAYEIRWDGDDGSSGSAVVIAQDSMSYQVPYSSLNYGTKYVFSVYATYGRYIYGPQSNEISIARTPYLSLQSVRGKVRISVPTLDNSESRYIFYYGIEDPNNDQLNVTEIYKQEHSSTGYESNPLKPGDTYQITAKIYNKANQLVAASSTVSVTISELSDIKNFVVTADNENECFVLNWDNVPFAESYTVEISATDRTGDTAIAVSKQVNSSEAVLAYNDYSVIPNSTYYFRVGAYTRSPSFFESKYSETVESSTDHIHNYSKLLTIADKTHTYKCKCGATLTESHTWDEGVISTEATHTETGTMTYHCTLCGATKSEVIPKTTEHSFGSWFPIDWVNHEKTCYCGDAVREPHEWTAWSSSTAPTHTETGTQKYTCYICELVKTETIPALGHEFGDWSKVDDESHTRNCACGASETEAHEWDAGVITTPATDSSTGVIKYTCTKCDATKSEEVPQLSYDEYFVLKDVSGGVEITDFTNEKNGINVVIPETLQGKTIVGIGNFAFSGTGIQSIVIPDSVSYIKMQAFWGCKTLKTVQMSNNVSSIGDYAFASSGITSITLPAKLSSFGTGAFTECVSLSSAFVPKGVTTIGGAAFADCISLKEVSISDSLASVKSCAFNGCSALSDVYYTGSSTAFSSIGIDTYNDPLRNAVKHYNSCETHEYSTDCDETCNNCDYSRTTDAPHQYGAWSSYNEDSHKRVCICGKEELAQHTMEYDTSSSQQHTAHCSNCEYSFQENHTWDNGEETTPATHTTPGIKTFTCTKCGDHKVGQIPVLTEHSFGSWTKVDENTHKRICECGAEESENHTWDNGVETTAATHTTTGIKTYTCSKCSATKTEVIPVLSEHSFSSWTKVDEDTHKGVCECGEEKTEDHTWNAGVLTTSPALGVVGIKTYTCTKCGYTREEQVDIIASGYCGLESSTSITWILHTNGTMTIRGNGKMASYGVNISSPWESHKSNILKVVIEEGVTTVGKFAFRKCTNLKDVEMANGVTTIGDSAFSGCSNLESVEFSESVTIIEYNAFTSCTKLSNIVLPSNIKEIYNYAFSGCTSIETLLFPNTIEKINGGAFNECSGLTSVLYDGSSIEWGKVTVGSMNDCISNHLVCLHVLSKEPSCTEQGNIEYWLGYNGTGYYTDSTRSVVMQENPIIPALNHAFGNPTYTWSGSQCTASMVCTHDQNHVVSETVTAEYVKDTDATCAAAETGHYEASFDNAAFTSQETEADSVVNGTALPHGDWVYSSNGAVLTATCGHGTCGHTETATVILSADTFTYNGEAKTPASITYSDGFPVKTLTVDYEGNTNAGTATASISVGNTSASIGFNINKATIAEEMTMFNAAILPAKNSTTEVGLPELPQGATYGSINFGSISGLSGVISKGKLLLTVTGGAIPESVKEVAVQILVTGATNYENYTITVAVGILHKSVQMETPTLENGKVSLQITAVVAEPTVTHFVVACYDTDGRMIGISMATQTIDENTTTVPIDYPAGIKESDVASWQVMAMDANLLCPLGNAMEVN